MTKYSQIQLKYFVLSVRYYIITLKYNCFNALKYNCFTTLKCYPSNPIKVQGFTALKRYPRKPIGVQGFNALKCENPTNPVGEAMVHPISGFSKISFTLLVKFFALSTNNI